MPKQLKPSKSIIPKWRLVLAIVLVVAAVLALIFSKIGILEIRLRNLPDPLVSQYNPPGTVSPPVGPPKKYSGKVPILMYHYVEYNRDPADTIRASLTVTPYWFETQLKWLLDNGYQTIDLDTLVSGLTNEELLPKKPVVLTFDDGYRDFYTDAWPLLKKYQAKATVYVVSDFLDKHNYMYSWQLKEIATDSAGLVTIGAHTRHHLNLRQVPKPLLIDEILGSKNILEKLVQKPIRHFAYPYGAFNPSAVEEVVLSGFSSAVDTIFGQVDAGSDLFRLSRIRVGNYGGEIFKARLASQK